MIKLKISRLKQINKKAAEFSCKLAAEINSFYYPQAVKLHELLFTNVNVTTAAAC